MSDRVGVMSHGVLEQVDTPDKIYNSPKTSFVATFVGENNAFPGRVFSVDGPLAVIDTRFGPIKARNEQRLITGDDATVFVRPERCGLINGTTPDNVLQTSVERLDLEGSFYNLFVRGSGEQSLIIHMTNDRDVSGLSPGNPVRIGFRADDCVALPSGALAHD
jgi:spermidine/putrescine transport system ATP-binding protein